MKRKAGLVAGWTFWVIEDSTLALPMANLTMRLNGSQDRTSFNYPL